MARETARFAYEKVSLPDFEYGKRQQMKKHPKYVLLVLMPVWITGMPSFAQESEPPGILLSSRIATNGDFLTLPITIDEVTHLFVVGIGIRTTILDAALCADLTPTIDAATKTPGMPARMYLPPKMVIKGTEIGAIPFPEDSPILSKDLRDIRKGTSFAVHGILGMDFLQAYAVALDPVEGLLHLLEGSAARQDTYDARLPLEMSEGLPFVQVCVAGRDEWALVATAAMLSCAIQRDLYRKLTEREQVRKRMIRVFFENQRRTVFIEEGWLRELTVGPFSHRTVLVKPRDFTSLGLYYWLRYRCVFDFVDKTVYLRKSAYFELRDDSDQAGIWTTGPADPGGGRRIKYVAIGSDAESLGIREGDLLLSIDGRDVSDERPDEIYRQLSFRTTHRRLILRREGREFEVVLPSARVPMNLCPLLDDASEGP